MNKSLGSELIVCSVLLTGLSYLVHYLVPEIARPTLIAGMAGGVLCFVWGLLAVLGKCGKALPVLTLLPMCFVMVWQAVVSWKGRNTGSMGHQMVPVVIIVALAFTLAMLLNIIYARVALDGQPGKPKSNTNRHV
jgi:hypothetical protein